MHFFGPEESWKRPKSLPEQWERPTIPKAAADPDEQDNHRMIKDQ